ncbi:MAG: hypothetical protein H6728_03260 [Myxococcales bacterium]|nr:hypothetical protein [Myxococcales bacterium]MCB9642069.1 hypothetical protein [Myxococcales bacterium]
MRPWLARIRDIYPLVGLLLIFSGPYFLYSCISFLRKVDYIAATLALLAGASLLLAGVELSRAWMATSLPEQETKPKKNDPEDA